MQTLEDLLRPGEPRVTVANLDPELRTRLRLDYDWLPTLECLGIKYHQTANGNIDISCIFHQEKTPSMRLWLSGFFYCHGCQVRGDIVDFVCQFYRDKNQPLRLFLPPPDPNQGTLFPAEADGSGN